MANKYELTANGEVTDFSRVEFNVMKVNGSASKGLPPIRGGLTNISFDYGPAGRENVYGNAPEPVGQTNGQMEYSASMELLEQTWQQLIAYLGAGYMRADHSVRISLVYGITRDGVQTTTRVAIYTTIGKASGSWAQGGALKRSVELFPRQIRDMDENGNELEPMG